MKKHEVIPLNPPLSIDTEVHPDETGYSVTANSLHGSYSGRVYYDDYSVLIGNHLFVSPEHRRQGIGEALVKNVADMAKQLRVERFTSYVLSPYVLDIRAQLFGEDALHFYEDPNNIKGRRLYNEPEFELPMTFAQARQSLVFAQENKPIGAKPVGFEVVVELN